MPVVPTYEDRGIRLDPGLNFRDTTHATPEMFGSGIGTALGTVGKGLMDLGGAVAEVADLDATNTAKDNNNGFMGGARELSYGENGYMNTTGRVAVEGLDAYRKGLLQLAQDGAKGLSPLAARKYWDATNVTLNSLSDEAAKHAMQQRKVWTAQTSRARVDTFRESAAASWGQPNAEKLDVIAAFTEYQQLGNLLGWKADELAGQSAGLISDVHEDGILRKAEGDPRGAAADIETYKGFLLPEAQERLKATVGKAALDEETRLGALEFAAGKRASPDTDTAVAPPTIGGEQPATRSPGPTLKRAVLLDHAAMGTDPAAVLGLDDGFASNLSAFIEDAPAEIRAGLGLEFTGAGRQDASADAPRAASLTFNGARLDAAPAPVQDWVLRTAGKYGLRLPSGIGLSAGDPNGGRLVATSDGLSARASMPSLANAEDYLQTIPDPRRRELARQTILNAWELRSREEAERQRAAKAEVWRRIDSGSAPDDIPYDMRQAAGMEAMTAARTYYTKKLADQAVVTDPEMLRNLRLTAATRPQYFVNLDLNDYRDLLSDGDYRDLTERQASMIENDRAARERGPDLVTAFKMAEVQLEATGVLKPKEEKADEDRQRLARFQNDLYGEIAALQVEKPGHIPNPQDFQRIINKLLLPILIKTPGLVWDSETPARLFDAKHLKDGQTYELNILPEDIPVDLRGRIRKELEMELGKQPTDEQLGAEYGAIAQGKPLPFAGTRRGRELATGSRRDAALKGR